MSDNFDAASAPVTWAGRTPAGAGRARCRGPVLRLVPAGYVGRPVNWWITVLSGAHRHTVTGAGLPAARTMHHAHGQRPCSAARKRDFSERGGLGGSSGWPAGKPTTAAGLPADPEKA